MILACALGLLAAAPKASQEVVGAGELRHEELATPAGPRAGLPNLVCGGDGRLYLSWIERREPGDAGGPRRNAATLYYAAWTGGGWGEVRAIASGDDWFLNWADFPALAVHEDGRILATWLERTGGGTYDYGIRTSLSRDGGPSWTPPAWLHDHTGPGEHGFVSIVPLASTSFGAVWLDGRNAGSHGADANGATSLFFRTILGDGTLGPEVLLDARVCDCCPTSLAVADRGDLVAAYRDRGEAEVRDVAWVRRLAPSDEPPSTDRQELGLDGAWLEPGTAHEDGWELAGCPVNGPRIVAQDGREALVWYTGAGGGAGRVQAAFASGGALGPAAEIDDGAPIGRVEAAFLADGSLAVVWLEHEGDGATWRVRRVEDGDSSPPVLGPSTPIASVSSDRASGHLRMARRGDSLYAAWSPGPGKVATARLWLAAGDEDGER